MFPQTPPSEGEEPFPRYTAQTPITTLLDRNRTWAERQERENPLLFPSLANSQHPQILWIGCSDSRVPETTVLDLLPGDLFVHRNIANVVSAGDLSVLSVVQFAVEVLQVNHIIVCGHYGCGGCIAALGNKKLGLIDNWLRHIRDVRASHAKELDSLDGSARVSRLVELNVVEQVNSAKRIPTVQAAMEERGLQVHGWVYDVSNGRIKPLETGNDACACHYEVIGSDESLE